MNSLFKGRYRNLKCGCNSGRKFKKCCYNKLNGWIETEKNMWIKRDNNPNQLATIR